MRSFILLIVIAILANIGKAIPIKVLGQPTDKKMLSEVRAEVLVGNNPSPSAKTQVETPKARDFSAQLRSVNAEDIIKGDGGAILNLITVATELVDILINS